MTNLYLCFQCISYDGHFLESRDKSLLSVVNGGSIMFQQTTI